MASVPVSSGSIASRLPPLVLETLLGEGTENAQIGVYMYDDQGRYVAVNSYAAELLGYDRQELLSHTVGDFTEHGIDPGVLQRLERREGVRIVRRKDGTEVPVAFVITPTRVATLQFFLAFVWELSAGDPRLR